MAQEPSSKDLLEAVKQQESGGRRYKADGKTLLEGPQTKYGTAKGEMQVLDMTNRDPGFGVRPAKDDSPDERARVGEDYLAAMVKRYGNRETALVAYNWGPGNTDNWLKSGADPAKLPKETQNYVAKITGSLGSTKVAQAPAKAAPVKAGIQKTAFNPTQNPMFAQLGPSYQAAFAVSMLADEGEKEGKSEDEPSESEKMLMEATARPVALASADLSYQSPFPEPQKPPQVQPVKMAAGGVPTAVVRPSARKELEAIKAQYAEYEPKVAEYNTAVEKYKTDVYNPYQTQVDAYNAALEKYKAEQFNPYQAQIDAYNAALNKYKTETYDPYQAQVDKYNADYAAFYEQPKSLSPFYFQKEEKLLKSRPVAPAEFSMAAPVAPAQFGGVAPTKPAEFSLTAPTAPPVSQAEYDAKVTTAKADTADRQLALNVAMNPEAYGLSMPKFDFNMPTFMADGGQVYRAAGSPDTGEYFQDPFGVPDSGPVTADTLSKGKEFKAADALQAVKEVGAGGARNLKNIARGTTETPYNFFGAAADIGNMLLTPVGLGSAEPALGSAHLKRLATEAGIRPAPPTDPRDAGFYMMGELGASVVNPSGVVRGGVKATGKAADLLRDMKKPKQVPQTAPAPAPMAGPTPEVQTELARMDEQRQLPRNAGQAPDPLMGVRPTLEEAQANVAARQAEQLPPPPAEVAVPPEMLEMPPVAPPMQAGMPAERPFVGRLDAFIDTIKNPVQLGQLKGQLKGKFRDYDIERVERAFAGMDDKAKLTPDQIKQALASTHSPGKWISETLPPEKGKYHQNMDNIWGKELGTTNLYLEQPEQTLLATKLFDEGGTSLGAFVANSTTTPTLKKLEDARKLLSNPDLTKIANLDLVSRISAKLDTAENNIKLIDQFGQDIQNIERGFARPVLFQQNGESVWFKFKDDFIKGKKTEIEQQFMDQGMTRAQALSATHDQLFGNNNAVYLAFVREAEIASSKKVQDLAREQARSHSINIPDLGINWNNPSLKPMDPLSVTTRVNAQTDRAQAALQTALEPSVQTIHEASKNVQRFMSDDVKELGLVLQNAAAYRGKHKGVAAGPYPIGFTRFSEHETTIPGMGTVQGRHFHELQSDLSKDMRKSGTVGGSAAKDTKELDSLQAQINKYRDDTFAQFQAFQQEHKNGTLDYAGYMEKQQKARDALENKINPLEQRMSVLGSRTRSNAPYSLQEPFAGFETNPMVRQQLLMKNAIQSAMRDGKSFATFPGNESAKPQLYVGKVTPNLKQVIKDLGGEKSGLELRQIELPPDKDGRPITATGVVWSPEAAARIMKTGVPFAKGGSVERLSADNRRYL